MWIEKAQNICRKINEGLLCFAGIILMVMVLLTCTNIFFRTVWFPVRGTFELMGYFGAVVAAFSLGYTRIRRGHIAVDVLVIRFSPKVRNVLHFINGLVCLFFFGMAARQIGLKGLTLFHSGEVTETLRIAYYPFVFATALGFVALALVFLVELFESVISLFKGEH